MYVTNEQNNQLVVWYKENNSPANIISGNLNGPSNLFVTTSGDIYVDSDNSGCGSGDVNTRPNPHPRLIVHNNSKADACVTEFRHSLYKKLHRVSHFNPTGIALTAFFRLFIF
jgi:hypothetical protein